MEARVKSTIIKLVNGDITGQEVDAIVNTANTSLLGGGGVDGAIHKAGGKAIIEECMKIKASQGGCNVGEAVITTAGNMKAKKIAVKLFEAVPVSEDAKIKVKLGLVSEEPKEKD
jgi:O-acetyl-ADP-ribose deacetylase (regulator of RNase III)